VVAPVTAGIEMDVLGLTYHEYADKVWDAVVSARPRTPFFQEDIIAAFYNGSKHKSGLTFGTVKPILS
jgi:hypothetical protein